MAKIKSIIGLCLIFSLAGAIPALGLPPPGKVEQVNLAADIIVYGRVETFFAEGENSYFDLNIGHVIKGIDQLPSSETLRIFCRFESGQTGNTGNLVKHTQGVLPVKVGPGDKIIAYLKQNENNQYVPALKGLSIVVVEAFQAP